MVAIIFGVATPGRIGAKSRAARPMTRASEKLMRRADLVFAVMVMIGTPSRALVGLYCAGKAENHDGDRCDGQDR